MLRNIPVYFALAILAVSCGGNSGDSGETASDDKDAAVAEAESAPAVAEGNGRALYAPCVTCHGANGEGNMALNAPGIAGQSETYVARQLWEFKKGLRGAEPGDLPGAQMRPMAMALADGEAIADVAAYIASMPATTPPVTIEGDADNGERLYVSLCGACHGGKAWGNEALFTPRLTMLGDSYVVRQVKKFQEGMRGTHEDSTHGKQMALMAKTVSDEELNDIVAYLNALAAE